MKILVTGGAGFIGGHISVALKDKGYDVIVVDNMENAPMREKIKSHGIETLVIDLRADVEIPSADVIIHTAAYVDAFESFSKPFDYIVNNTAVTARIADLAWKKNSYLVYLSSASVYGDPVYLPIDENHPRNPLSPYGLSKKLGEDVIEFYSRLGLRATILRLFNVYGPCQSKAYAGVISRFINQIRRGQPLVIYGDGNQTRDFIHIYDVVELVRLLVERPSIGVFNVGSGRQVSIIELARMLSEITNSKINIVFAPARPGEIRHSVANIKKVMELGWRPRIQLMDGLRELLIKPDCLDE